MLVYVLAFLSKILLANGITQPNLVLIIADDLGYNDVGYRGNNQVKTPNIDALAYNGAVLEKFYTLPMCSPSRAAILTGNYPIRSGFQGWPLNPGEERHLPSDMPTLPEQLKKLGYKTHLVGKWHLGSARRNTTPIGRGFDSHFGYYNGLTGYFDHKVGSPMSMIGLDFWDDFRVNREDTGTYATDLFTNKSVDIINKHNYSEPLFLMISHLAPHTGKMTSLTESILEVKDNKIMNQNFGYVKDVDRRRYVDIVKSLDDSVGTVIKALLDKKVLDNTYILFMSDNGGPTAGLIHVNYASNWPLKGIKISHYEGSIRGTAIFYSKRMIHKGRINSNLMHVSDILPTFYVAGGGRVKDLGKLDGINQIDSLLKNRKTSRRELLVNIEDAANSSAIITHRGKYKLIKGIQYKGAYDGYEGVSGRLVEDGPYDVKSVLESDVNVALNGVRKLTELRIFAKRSRTSMKNCRRPTNYGMACELCLFDLEDDPCETTNLADCNKRLVSQMLRKIDNFRKQLIPQQNKPADPASDPINFGGVWSHWLDSTVV